MSRQWWHPVDQYLLADCPAFDGLCALEYQRSPTLQAGSHPGEVGGCCCCCGGGDGGGGGGSGSNNDGGGGGGGGGGGNGGG